MEYMSSLQNNFDDFKPSLFELLSEQQLSSLLPPSLRYLLAVATHRHPRYLLRILNSYDELYALVSLLVEGYYLRNFSGSFTENFYSLKRERVLALRDGEVPRAQLGAGGPVRETLKLRDSDIWRNLVVMVGIPYLKRKLDEGYDIHAAPHAALVSGMGGGPRYHPSDELPHNPTVKQRLLFYYKWFLRNVYPSINGAYYFSILAFNLAYLFDNTKYSSPFLWLIGTRIRRLSPADHKAIAMATAANTPHTGASRSRSRPSALSLLNPQAIYPHLLGSLKILLPASIFALKFLEWWHASDFSRQLAKQATQSIELPAPVVTGIPSKSTATDVKSEKSTLAEADRPKQCRTKSPISSITLLPIFTVPIPPVDPDTSQTPCPICLNALVNPTACQTGYVYCYTCIFRWLNGEHDRQIEFMNGAGNGAAWEDDDKDDENEKGGKDSTSREGRWENGKGRCPITGRRVLGGTDGLRRVLV
ncbi:peroxisome biosynthesis protein [Trichophyton rubrum]|uniref:Peroxisome assembly protein 12 n=4 Tax=Trichophyton TaxID=5550 RepID=A0A178EXZ9_TRIRU|nr:peroxisome biosynthesis protein [Trichophyton rubrum]